MFGTVTLEENTVEITVVNRKWDTVYAWPTS